MTKEEIARIKAEIKSVESRIAELKIAKPGMQNNGTLLIDKEYIRCLISRNEGSITALKWVLGEIEK